MTTDYSNVEFKSDDFVLVQDNKKIYDTKLATKPTTFFKDALKRFAKNKSSVVAAVLLGILLLLTIMVPVFMPGNIYIVNTPEAFLAPKLFEAGTGFWDGTREKTDIIYDWENEVPALSDKYSKEALKQSIISINIDEEPSLIDVASAYGKGGYIVFATDVAMADNDAMLFSQNTAFTAKDHYRLNVVFGDEDGVSESKLGEYRVMLLMGEEGIILRDFSTDYSPLNVDISSVLEQAGIEAAQGRIMFEIKSSADAIRYIMLKSVSLTADETASNYEDLALISFDDATQCINVSDTKDPGYWACTGRKGIHNSEVYYCDFVVDTYMLVYGDADLVTYSATELGQWIENGWCEYDYKAGPESFRRLDDRCPVDIVDSQSINSRTKKLLSINARGWNYRKYGYDEMPKFIMGTDPSGFDVFKRSFAALRTSLLLSLIVTVFCFSVGLVWGSISGYFGGTVDLAMERFCEILGGIPWIVIMTLAILHFGNNFATFVMAISLTGWMGTAALTRTQFYRFKGREYILASRTLGAKDTRLIFRHILPNSMGTIITSSVFMISGTIYNESSLAFLNLGLQGKLAFGVIMASYQKYLSAYPNLVLFPAVIMTVLMISLNLFGNGLRDAFNPSLKGSE